MNWIDSVIPWKVPNQRKIFDFLRILLGLFILYKGVYYALNFNELTRSFTLVFSEINMDMDFGLLRNIILFQEISQNLFLSVLVFMSIYVFVSHIFGGFLLALGLYTRWLCVILLPILFMAVFMVNIPKGISSPGNIIELGTSIIVFTGLIYFFISGAGARSLDELRRRDLNRIEGMAH